MLRDNKTHNLSDGLNIMRDAQYKTYDLESPIMSAPKTSLAGIICNVFGIELDSEEFYVLFGQSVSYITKGITAFKFQHFLKPYCKKIKTSAKVFRLMLHKTKYLSLDMKMFMLRMARVKSVTLDVVKALTKEFDLWIIDAKRIVEVWKTQNVFRARLKKVAKAIPKDGAHLLTHAGLKVVFNRLYPKVYKYIKYITHKKLSFLIRSTNQTPADFHNELLEKVVQAFYSQVPIMKEDAHMINSLNLTAHNHMVNIIKAETSLKRGRLVAAGVDRNGMPRYELLCAAENQRAVKADTSENLDYTDVDTGNDMQKFELQFSVSEILSKLETRSKKHRLMLLLMGTEDVEFSNWLRAKKVATKAEDNVDVQVRVSVAEFNRLVSAFLHVSETNTNVFLLKLRKQLALPEKARVRPDGTLGLLAA